MMMTYKNEIAYSIELPYPIPLSIKRNSPLYDDDRRRLFMCTNLKHPHLTTGITCNNDIFFLIPSYPRVPSLDKKDACNDSVIIEGGIRTVFCRFPFSYMTVSYINFVQRRHSPYINRHEEVKSCLGRK